MRLIIILDLAQSVHESFKFLRLFQLGATGAGAGWGSDIPLRRGDNGLSSHRNDCGDRRRTIEGAPKRAGQLGVEHLTEAGLGVNVDVDRQYKALGHVEVLANHPPFNDEESVVHHSGELESDSARNMSDLQARTVYHLASAELTDNSPEWHSCRIGWSARVGA